MATLHDIIKKGAINRSVTLRIIDSGDGTPETGVVFNAAGIDLWYRRESSARVAITEATLAALTTAHADGGFLHISDGEYRLDLPDAAYATGAQHVDFGGTVTGMVVIGGRVRLVDYDPEDTVRLGLTAMPNAAADAAGGLPISDAGGLDLDGRLDAAVSTRSSHTAAAVWSVGTRTLTSFGTLIVDIWHHLLTGITTASTIGKLIKDNLDAAVSGIPTTAMRGTDGALTDKAGFSLAATGLDAIVSTAVGMVEIAKAIWDRVLTGATHNIANSAGRRLRQVEAAFVLHSGTAQAGASNTITLDAGANATDDFYNHTRVVITGGTGVEQERIIVDYVGSTKVAKIAPPWVTDPDVTSEFEIEPALSHAETGWNTIKIGLAAAGAASTITLDSDASAVDDFYNDDLVHLDAGVGEGQSRVITDYDGTTKIATVHKAWTTIPDTTSEYIVEEAHPYTPLIKTETDKLALVDAGAGFAGSVIEEVENRATPAQVATELGTYNGPTRAEATTDKDAILARILTQGVAQNAAFPNFTFEMVLTSDHVTPATGLTVTAQRLLDGGAYAAVAGTIAEISNGTYQFDALAADTNGDFGTWKFSAATADDVFVHFKTTT